MRREWTRGLVLTALVAGGLGGCREDLEKESYMGFAPERLLPPAPNPIQPPPGMQAALPGPPPLEKIAINPSWPTEPGEAAPPFGRALIGQTINLQAQSPEQSFRGGPAVPTGGPQAGIGGAGGGTQAQPPSQGGQRP